jgi:GTP-binding protein
LCRKRSAIVDQEEGITRDRKYETVEWLGKTFLLVDTGGIVINSTDDMDKAVRRQAEIAILEADLILFLVDAKVDVTGLDLEVGRILKPHSHKVMIVVNKADTFEEEIDKYNFMTLGFGEPVAISASHGRHIGDLLDEIISRIEVLDEPEEAPNEIKVAIVGKPNVGKSSILNRLVGDETAIVTDIPGTTRDSIDSTLKYHSQTIRFIDTAGLRRRRSVEYGVEMFSVMRTIESIQRSDVVILVISAVENVTEQDQKIASYVARNYKNLIVVINKWDLIEKDAKTMGEFVKDIREILIFIDYTPILFTSAMTNQRVYKILDLVLKVYEESKMRIPTSELNDFLENVIKRYPPSHSSGRHVKIYYCSQVAVQPPTFIFFCNDSKLITESYKRYVNNKIREYFKFEGVSIKIIFRTSSGETK